MFFAVTRVEEANEANMKVGYCNVAVAGDVNVTMPWSSDKMQLTPDELPQIPIMYNPKKVAKHSLLKCNRDFDLQKVDAAIQKKRGAELQKNQEAAKKAKKT